MAQSQTALRAISRLAGQVPTRLAARASPSPSPQPSPPGSTAIEISPVARPHGQAPNLNPNRNLARLRFLEIKSRITIKSGRKPFRLNSTAVPPGRGRILRWLSAQPGAVSAQRTSLTIEPAAGCSLSPWERVRVRGIGLLFNTATRTLPEIVELRESSVRAGGFPRQ